MLMRQNTVTQYIVTQKFLYLYDETAYRPGTWIAKRLWEQEVLDLAGAWMAAAAEEVGRGEEIEG